LKWCLLRQLNRESGAGGGRTSSSHQQCARIRFQSYNEQLPNLSAQVIGLPLGLHQLDSADSHRPEQQLAFKVWRGGGGPASHDYTMRAEFPEKFEFLGAGGFTVLPPLRPRSLRASPTPVPFRLQRLPPCRNQGYDYTLA
jgi:hypothetical protein